MKMVENYMARAIDWVKTPCFYCGGRGKVLEMNAYDEEAWVTCFDCGGEGYILKEQ